MLARCNQKIRVAIAAVNAACSGTPATSAAIGVTAETGDFLDRGPQVGDDVAHHALGFAVGVALGVVEQIDAVVPGDGDEFARGAAADLAADRHPRAE